MSSLGSVPSAFTLQSDAFPRSSGTGSRILPAADQLKIGQPSWTRPGIGSRYDGEHVHDPDGVAARAIRRRVAVPRVQEGNVRAVWRPDRLERGAAPPYDTHPCAVRVRHMQRAACSSSIERVKAICPPSVVKLKSGFASGSSAAIWLGADTRARAATFQERRRRGGSGPLPTTSPTHAAPDSGIRE